MKNLKGKKGISLIVLVLTIIIMIILATAIILLLNNSEIIGKASKAKNDSDSASLIEYVNVLQAEYEFMSETEREGKTSIEYVNSKLAEKGYKRRLNEDSILLMENTIDAIDAGIKIGDVVKYEVTSKTETSKSADNGYGDQDISNQTNLTWRYIGVGYNGEIMIAPDVTSDAPKLTLKGTVGYLKGPDELNRLCNALYTTDKGTARSMTIEDVNKILGYTGGKGGYLSILENKFIVTDTPLTIQQIIDTKGEPAMVKTTTPESGKDIGTYKSDYYGINKSSNKITNTENVDYVFYGSDSTSCYYWLASPCVQALFTTASYADFRVRRVDAINVTARALFLSRDFRGG